MAIQAPEARSPGPGASLRALVASSRRQTLVAVIAYAVLSLEFFGVYALPHLGRQCVCNQVGNDPATYMWYLAWWPHALLHGTNPFFTNVLFAPNHLDLGAGTVVPGAALVMTPVTMLFGPLVTYNLIALAAPVLAALFAFLLCRYITGSFPAALVGGYLFGFTAYMLSHMLGHLNLVLIFPIPAGVHLVLRLIDGHVGTRPFVALMALNLIALITSSTELALTFVVVGAVALAVAMALVPHRRTQIAAAFRPMVLAGALAAIVTSPFIYYALRTKVGGAFAGAGDAYGSDLLGFVVPTNVTGLGASSFTGIASTFNGHDLAESGIYVGIPLLLIVAGYFVTRWRIDASRLLLALFAIVGVLMLGAHLRVDGDSTIPLPWRAVEELPLIKQALPARLGVYMFLAVALIVSLWLAGPTLGRWGVGRWAAAAIGIAFVFPNLSAGLWHTRPDNPEFFTTTSYRHYLHRGETVLALPFTGYSMLWQAETGMWFRLAGGNLAKLFPANYQHEPVVPAFYRPPVYSEAAMRAQAGPLEAFLVRHRVGAVIVDQADTQQWPITLAALGLKPVRVGGILLYSLPASGRAAG